MVLLKKIFEVGDCVKFKNYPVSRFLIIIYLMVERAAIKVQSRRVVINALFVAMRLSVDHCGSKHL